MTNESRTSIRLAAAAFALVAAAASTNAFALDMDHPSSKPATSPKTEAKEANTATTRPVAIRLDGTLSLLSYYSVGITAGYAFHRLFALEGTAAWEGGFTHGIMGRLRLPVTSWASISVGIGASVLWVPWKGTHNWPGVYMWLPGEIGWEYRTKGGYHFLIGAGARLLTYANQEGPDFPWCILFCLADPPKIYPAARIGIGWAF